MAMRNRSADWRKLVAKPRTDLKPPGDEHSTPYALRPSTMMLYVAMPSVWHWRCAVYTQNNREEFWEVQN